MLLEIASCCIKVRFLDMLNINYTNIAYRVYSIAIINIKINRLENY